MTGGLGVGCSELAAAATGQRSRYAVGGSSAASPVPHVLRARENSAMSHVYARARRWIPRPVRHVLRARANPCRRFYARARDGREIWTLPVCRATMSTCGIGPCILRHDCQASHALRARGPIALLGGRCAERRPIVANNRMQSERCAT